MLMCVKMLMCSRQLLSLQEQEKLVLIHLVLACMDLQTELKQSQAFLCNIEAASVMHAEEEDEIDPLDAFMMGNNAAGAAQQQTAVKPDPDSKAPGGPPSRTPLAGGPAVNGKAKRAPARRGKRSMYDTDSSSEEEDEEELSDDDEDDEVRCS